MMIDGSTKVSITLMVIVMGTVFGFGVGHARVEHLVTKYEMLEKDNRSLVETVSMLRQDVAVMTEILKRIDRRTAR